MSIELKIKRVSPYDWDFAIKVAKSFIEEYPERIGLRDGVGYTCDQDHSIHMYVYRTKTQVIVVGNE